MSHEFTSGVFANGQAAWHGLGDVIEGTMPAREMFEQSKALFEVGKAPIAICLPDGTQIPVKKETQALYRKDSGDYLATVSAGYVPIQNERLLGFAEMLREEIDMDAVVVLAGGRKVAFTGKIRGTANEVLPGDTVHRHIVGYLGHDGKTAFGGMFTNVRVVCANTLGFAMDDANKTGKQFQIRHSQNDVDQIDRVLESIDMARQSFADVVDDYKAMAEVKIGTDEYRHFLERVYRNSGQLKPSEVIECKKRKLPKLMDAWYRGIGGDIPGVKGTLWSALNAVTQVESSPRNHDDKGARAKRHSALFGSGKAVIEVAEKEALSLV